MSRAHARRKTGRGQVISAHAGQARSATRKRLQKQQKLLLERRKLLTARNYAQTAQDKADCHIIIRGLDNWTLAFKDESIKISPQYQKLYGTDELTMLDYLRLNSDLNRVSYERSILSELLSKGYEFEALEVNIEGKNWGLCKWYRVHPEYEKPVDPMFRRLDASLLNAMFETERAGEQGWGLYSSQMVGNAIAGQRQQILLHKTLIYRKAILFLPREGVRAEAA